MRTERDRAWIGVDIGKTHDWVCAIDENGQKMLSLKVLNDEAEILEVITAVSGLAGGRMWAIDILGTPSALLVALLAQAGSKPLGTTGTSTPLALGRPRSGAPGTGGSPTEG